jgi:DNA-binding SARP family transcriptional activator
LPVSSSARRRIHDAPAPYDDVVAPTPTICVLGGVHLVRAGRVVHVRRARERAVLAVLVAARGRPVSADRLVTEVWGDQAPASALAALQVAVARLRVVLEPDRQPRAPATILRSTAAGYVLAAGEEHVDVWTFDRRVEQALRATSPETRLEAASAGWSLWSGEPYAGSDAPLVHQDVERLVERRTVLAEVLARALIDLGEVEQASAVTGALLPDHPFRERLWSLHAHAQYLASRQADALGTLRTLRRALADELGIDPSPEVARLEQAVLSQDPGLAGPVLAGPVLAGPVLAGPARRPVGDPAGAASPSAPGPEPDDATGPSVGRDELIGSLRDRVEGGARRGAAGPTGAFVLVTGEPGIGKTHVVDRLVAQVRADGVLAVVGRGHADFAAPLWPWLPVVRDLWAEHPHPADEAALDPLLREGTVELDDGQGAGLRLLDAVRRTLDRAAAERPVLLVLEDLQWADLSSLRLLSHLASVGVPPRVTVLVTARDGEAPESGAVTDVLAGLARAGVTRIRLGGLGVASVSELLDAFVGSRAAGWSRRVAELTTGNPFYVREYARLLVASPELAGTVPDRLPVPEGVRDVLRQRVARLPRAAASLLTVAAVAGTQIDPELVAALLGLSSAEVLDALDLALASGLLAASGPGYAFEHALLRETLQDELSAARRLRLHDRIATELSLRAVDTPDHLAEVAHHARLAAPLGPDAARRAATALVRAARATQSRLASDDALVLWDQALALPVAGADLALTVDVLCGRAHALQRLGRVPEARAAVVRAVTRAAAQARWELVPSAVAVLNRSGVWAWREHGVKDEEFVGALHRALEHLDAAGRARVLATLQVEHYYAWESEVAEALGDRSLEFARASGDEAVWVEVLLAGIVAGTGPGKAVRRLARIDELRSLPLGPDLSVFAEFLLAGALYQCARVAEAEAAIARCTEAVAELRHTGVEVPLAWLTWARARETEDGERLAAAAGLLRRLHEGRALTGAGLDLLYRLRIDSGGRPPDEALLAELATAPPVLRALAADDLAASGDVTAAIALLGDPSPDAASDYSVLAEACLRLDVLARAGLLDDVQRALGRLRPFTGAVVTYGGVEHLGAVDYFLAVGHAALGDADEARRLLARATDLLDRLGNRAWRRRADALASEIAAAPGPVDPRRA